MRAYTVKPGDTLGRIARKLYGDASRYPLIVSANRIADPDRLAVGRRLVIPDADVAGRAFASGDRTLAGRAARPLDQLTAPRRAASRGSGSWRTPSCSCALRPASA